MNGQVISLSVLKELLGNSAPKRGELRKTYREFPETECMRNARCCTLLPDTTLLEALVAVHRLMDMPSAIRHDIIQGIVRYFFLNPVEIMSCPFLVNRDCMIYGDRFFGCRAYGLWSMAFYRQLSQRTRDAKRYVRDQWTRLGVVLPQEVTGHEVPYCEHVKISGGGSCTDERLLSLSGNIEEWSGNFPPWHQFYQGMYFSDLSFLVTALVFGVHEAVNLKFRIVSDLVKTGICDRLTASLEQVPDIFSALC
jgi:hypothetical protein